MPANQHKLCAEVLRRLAAEGQLEHMVLIGSWCLLVYRQLFRNSSYRPAVRTSDVDLLIPAPSRIRKRTDIESLLRDLDFVTSFRGKRGFIKFVHEDLVLEFLVPERGRGSDKPFPLPELGTNATQLRCLGYLAAETIVLELEGTSVTVPAPARFGLHKLLVSTKRRNRDKSRNDRRQGVYLLRHLVEQGLEQDIVEAWSTMPKSWQPSIRAALASAPLGEEILPHLTT